MMSRRASDDDGVGFDVDGDGSSGGNVFAGADVAFGGAGFDEAGGEVAAGGDEERAGAHGDVGDPQLKDVGAAPERPLCPVGGLERAG